MSTNDNRYLSRCNILYWEAELVMENDEVTANNSVEHIWTSHSVEFKNKTTVRNQIDI